MGKITKHDSFIDVELDAKDFFQFNTPLLTDLVKYAWMMLKKKAPQLSDFNQASRLLLVDGKIVGRFYKYMDEAQNDKAKAENK